MNQRIMSLTGNIAGIITITSSCIVHILDDCICEQLVIDTSPRASIYFIGDITKISSITIKSGCFLYSSKSIYGFIGNSPLIVLDVPSGPDNHVYIGGNYSSSEIKVIQRSNITLNGHFRLLSSEPGSRLSEVTIFNGSIIESINIKSMILLNCPLYLLMKLKNPNTTPGAGHDNLIQGHEVKEVIFENGVGEFLYKINEPGIYVLTVYLQKDNDCIPIGNKTITVY